MAIEYLQTGCLTITSDVWSYGIVFWEIFSLGKEPYAGQNSEEMILKLKDGYRLPCPEEVTEVSFCNDVSHHDPSSLYKRPVKPQIIFIILMLGIKLVSDRDIQSVS